MTEASAPATTSSNSTTLTSSESSPSENSTNESEGQEQQLSAPKPKKPNIKKYKIGDEEIALSDDDIVKNFQKWKGSDKAFREASEMRKSAEQFYKDLQENPEKVLNDPKIPLDKRKLAEKWLMESIEQEMNPTDPRDARMKALEDKIAEYENEKQSKAQEEEEKRYLEAKEQRKSEISKILSEAMNKTILSKHPETKASTLREMAMYMRICRERGEDVTADDIVDHIHNSKFNQFYTLANQFEGDELIDMLGEDVLKKIRKADLAKLRASRGQQISEQPQSFRNENRSSQAKEPKKMDGWEAKERANKLLFG